MALTPFAATLCLILASQDPWKTINCWIAKGATLRHLL